jgi:hypothetical protein
MRDFTYSEGCGCKVTFFAESEYHTSRMIPGVHCLAHTDRFQVAERSCFIERGREALGEYLDRDEGSLSDQYPVTP